MLSTLISFIELVTMSGLFLVTVIGGWKVLYAMEIMKDNQRKFDKSLEEMER